MSKLGCRCGHVIADQTNDLPYKASILPDLRQEEFFDWLTAEAQSYMEAVQDGRADAWLLERGYKRPYLDLKLNHSEILHDHIHTRFSNLKRDIYECEGCGRVHIESGKDNHFISYAPDNGKVNSILATVAGD